VDTAVPFAGCGDRIAAMTMHSSNHREAPRVDQPPIIGILLAAGRSTRMGLNKQLLPWPPGSTDGMTVAAASFDLLVRVATQVVLVEGASPELLRAALLPRSFVPTAGAPDGEMLESLKLGLIAADMLRRAELDARSALASAEGTSNLDLHRGWYLLHLADHPAVRESTMVTLRAHALANPEGVVIPEHDGRGGHPAFVPASWGSRILGWRGPDGLAGLWRSCADEVERVPLDDPGVRVDLDTPGEYHAHR